MIWLCLIVPIITLLVLAFAFHRHIVWWEYLLTLGVPTIAVIIANYTAIHFQTQDTEYWNTYGTEAFYYEEWNEWIEETCTREDCSGSGEDRECETEEYDCSYENYYPEYWEITDNIGQKHTISETYFDFLTRRWENKNFEEMNRDFHTIDGDAYFTTHTGGFEKLVSICKPHTYENRVMISKSVFNFDEVDTATIREYGLYNYIKQDIFDFDPIFGDDNCMAADLLSRYNALNGVKRQLHMMILVFKDKPLDAGMMQEAYWKGGNKNEFILCVGTSGNKIKWTKVISWTEVESLKVAVEQDVLRMDSLNIMSLVDYMGKTVPEKFVRKQFADFNYLKIEPSMTSVWITLAITIFISAGIGIFVVKNDIGLGQPSRNLFKYKRFGRF